ncbi:MAG TPA: hypothetical protein DCG39_07400 [Opitutae bacterium]|nr:hypothetical protein [Opitutae bacterium]
MNALSSIFFKLSGREQTLLVFSLWTIFLVCLVKLFGSGVDTFREWQLVIGKIDAHDTILDQEAGVNRKLEKKREEQKGVSYDLTLLQNEVDKIMRKFFQPRQARLFSEPTKSFEKHSQHDVRVKLTGVSWQDLKDFMREFFLDERQRYIFFSEVEIDPDYKRNPEVYNATFHISSVEFSK